MERSGIEGLRLGTLGYQAARVGDSGVGKFLAHVLSCVVASKLGSGAAPAAKGHTPVISRARGLA